MLHELWNWRLDNLADLCEKLRGLGIPKKIWIDDFFFMLDEYHGCYFVEGKLMRLGSVLFSFVFEYALVHFRNLTFIRVKRNTRSASGLKHED